MKTSERGASDYHLVESKTGGLERKMNVNLKA